jgi:hypothetical protein
LESRLFHCSKTDLTRARCNDLDAAKYLLKQLLSYKKGSDGSNVVILDRARGEVAGEALLDLVDVDALSLDEISFRPSIPRGNRIGSEFGVKVSGKAVVTFQVKHKRGAAHGTDRQYEFSDITTRLMR